MPCSFLVLRQSYRLGCVTLLCCQVLNYDQNREMLSCNVITACLGTRPAFTAVLGTSPFWSPRQQSSHFSSTSNTRRRRSPSLNDRWPLSDGRWWHNVWTYLQQCSQNRKEQNIGSCFCTARCIYLVCSMNGINEKHLWPLKLKSPKGQLFNISDWKKTM